MNFYFNFFLVTHLLTIAETNNRIVLTLTIMNGPLYHYYCYQFILTILEPENGNAQWLQREKMLRLTQYAAIVFPRIPWIAYKLQLDAMFMYRLLSFSASFMIRFKFNCNTVAAAADHMCGDFGKSTTTMHGVIPVSTRTSVHFILT